MDLEQPDLFPRDSLIHVVGYSLEKVHTGILAMLLEFNGPPSNLQFHLLGLFLELAPELRPQIIGCRTYREFKFGSNRADLVIIIDTGEHRVRGCCVEAKVDSNIRIEQLEQLRRKSSGTFVNSREVDWSFAVLAIGASRFTVPERGLGEWKLVGPSSIAGALDGKQETHGLQILSDWLQALLVEIGLRDRVQFPPHGSRDAETRKFGHARWYYAYDSFRSMFSEPGPAIDKKFNIYGVGHNAVCNESPSSGSSWNSLGKGSLFFWEFNSGDLFLKAKCSQNGNSYPSHLAFIKDELSARFADNGNASNRIGITRCPNRMSKGGYFSLFKWAEFFKEVDFLKHKYWKGRAFEYVRIQSEVNRTIESMEFPND